MNEHHAQFFRELRELMKNHGAYFNWMWEEEDDEYRAVWFGIGIDTFCLEQEYWPRKLWESSTGKYASIDAPQKDGEK